MNSDSKIGYSNNYRDNIKRIQGIQEEENAPTIVKSPLFSDCALTVPTNTLSSVVVNNPYDGIVATGSTVSTTRPIDPDIYSVVSLILGSETRLIEFCNEYIDQMDKMRKENASISISMEEFYHNCKTIVKED